MAYSPTLGRWLEQDPAGYLDSSNLYESFLGDPVSYADPTGLFASSVHAAITTNALKNSGLPASAIKMMADADVGVDGGWELNVGSFADVSNHGDNGVPGLTAAINNIRDQWLSLEGSRYQPAWDCDCKNVEYTLKAFGRMLHTIQDLYSHSNYVETMDAAAGGTSTPGTIPLWGMFNADDSPNIPAGVTSGTYWWPFDNAPGASHRRMAKDDPSHSASKVTNKAGTTMGTLAQDAATRATTEAWNEFMRRLQGTPFLAAMNKCLGVNLPVPPAATTQPAANSPTTLPRPIPG